MFRPKAISADGWRRSRALAGLQDFLGLAPRSAMVADSARCDPDAAVAAIVDNADACESAFAKLEPRCGKSLRGQLRDPRWPFGAGRDQGAAAPGGKAAKFGCGKG